MLHRYNFCLMTSFSIKQALNLNTGTPFKKNYQVELHHVFLAWGQTRGENARGVGERGDSRLKASDL